jgi:hypothetical protein
MKRQGPGSRHDRKGGQRSARDYRVREDDRKRFSGRSHEQEGREACRSFSRPATTNYRLSPVFLNTALCHQFPPLMRAGENRGV